MTANSALTLLLQTIVPLFTTTFGIAAGPARRPAFCNLVSVTPEA